MNKANSLIYSYKRLEDEQNNTVRILSQATIPLNNLNYIVFKV